MNVFRAALSRDFWITGVAIARYIPRAFRTKQIEGNLFFRSAGESSSRMRQTAGPRASSSVLSGYRSRFKREDAVTGIVAARAAGCFSAGLTTSFSEATLRASGADIVFGSFSELKALLSVRP